MAICKMKNKIVCGECEREGRKNIEMNVMELLDSIYKKAKCPYCGFSVKFTYDEKGFINYAYKKVNKYG